jgi:hypothetical protein
MSVLSVAHEERRMSEVVQTEIFDEQKLDISLHWGISQSTGQDPISDSWTFFSAVAEFVLCNVK